MKITSDIYGGDYGRFGLSASTVASAFGKMATKEDPLKGVAEEDVAASLLHLINVNIGQVAYLSAVNHQTKHILFAGNFLRRNPIAARFLSIAIDYWSDGQAKALFLKHEGYFGALGAFLLRDVKEDG